MSALQRVLANKLNGRFWRLSKSMSVKAAVLPKLNEDYLQDLKSSEVAPDNHACTSSVQSEVIPVTSPETMKFDPRLLENLEQLDKLFKEYEDWPVGLYAVPQTKLF